MNIRRITALILAACVFAVNIPLTSCAGTGTEFETENVSVTEEPADLENDVPEEETETASIFAEEYDSKLPELVAKTVAGEYNIKGTDAAGDFLTFTAEEAESTITLDYLSGSNIQYKEGSGSWTNYTKGNTITLAGIGDTVSFKGSEITTGADSHFTMTGKIAASGDVTSLTNEAGGDATLSDSCYYCMFSGCTGLTKAPALPVTTLESGCYCFMFSGCTGLTSAPDLPATTLESNCYLCMFSGCTGLLDTPALPATTLVYGCYCAMFEGCTGLLETPDLPATTLAEYCYESMFEGCTGLTSAPNLPATTLEFGCYQYMFQGCTGLTSAPDLPAATLAEYCYSRMFESCTGLLDAPTLPATMLEPGCYCFMFSGCTGLTDTPLLPATTLAEGCYRYMFAGCSKIRITEKPTTNTALDIGSFTAFPVYAVDEMFAGTGGSFTGTPEAGKKYYQYGSGRETCTVTYDANGHGTASAAETDQIAGEKVTKPADPAATGYTFGGWYKESGCKNAWNFAGDVADGSITLYAKWNANKYTVTWNNWDGTELKVDSVEYNTIPSYSGTTPVREGSENLTFKNSGWTPALVAVTCAVTYTAVFTAESKGNSGGGNSNGSGGSSGGNSNGSGGSSGGNSSGSGGSSGGSSSGNGGSSGGNSSGSGGSSGGSSSGGSSKSSIATYSKFWYTDANGNWRSRNPKTGKDVASAWLCDDVVTANGQSVWYLMNADGTMLAAGLVQDKTGNFYSIETTHNGYYGMLRYKNGYYDCNGQKVYLEFSRNHDGTFGAITNAEGLAKLKDVYGVTRFGIDNSSCTYSKTFE